MTPYEHLLISLVPSIMVMPGTIAPILFGEDESSQKILQIIRAGQSPYVFTVMSNPRIKESPERFYKIGVIAKAEAEDMMSPKIILRGLFRAETLNVKKIGTDDWRLWVVTVKRVEDENSDDYFINSHQNVMANMIEIRDLLVGFIIRAKGYYDFDDTLMTSIIDNFESTDWEDIDAVNNVLWATLCSVPDWLQKDKQPFLESTSLLERIDMCVKKLKERLRLLGVQKQNILKDGKPLKKAKNIRIQDSKEQNPQDEFINGAHADIKKKWDKFKEIKEYMSEDARDVVMEDIEKLKSFGNPQGNTYEWPKYMRRVGFILDLPWRNEAPEGGDIVKVDKILDEDHYGLEHVKGRISEGVAPRILNPAGKGQILCFIGPPGVGKTSLAKSVARALGKKYIRMSLGGVNNESQIRGHGITYVGAEPGEILKLIKRCGEKNPVFVIDEIDKLGSMSAQGDPSAAMLEVLDPEQNNSFKDHWVACGFDLSKVMFIATANVEDTIHPAIRDRMDIIRLPGYLEVEKIEIAKRYLIPRLFTDLGLIQNSVEVVWEEGLISKIIRSYTHEAGVRGLERTIATLLKKVCREYLKSKTENNPIQRFEITEKKVYEYLGPLKYFKDRVRSTKVGEAVGLAWTPVGGDILYVQAEMYPMMQDKKVLARTGMQGDVMRESDEVAMTVIKNINPELSKKLSENAIHLHIPVGAIPKDGPSAGVTIVSAVYSELEDRPVKLNLAMTGEIDLKRNVLPVGGIREKIVAAERAGIEEIIMPKGNERNLHDVPKDVKDKLRFHFVESVDQVLEIAFPKPR